MAIQTTGATMQIAKGRIGRCQFRVVAAEPPNTYIAQIAERRRWWGVLEWRTVVPPSDSGTALREAWRYAWDIAHQHHRGLGLHS